ncbi:MAG TPA: hypothetical protein VFE05_00025 [Longimicrobiaceae bacterium]|jgi:hypothetical protein|nr:hypothetical protein [Longimicrobiaceae bacterium]
MRVSKRTVRSTSSLLILTALSACDNVRWGGANVELVPPPPATGGPVVTPDAQTFADLGLPRGSVLFHVTREGNGVRIVPVAEVSGDSLRTLRRPAGVAAAAYESRFRDAVMAPGAELQLFRRGAPVGTVSVQGNGPATACGVPTATGTATAVAAAADVREFLAFRKGLAPPVSTEYAPPAINGSMTTFASIIAERLVLNGGLQRPRSWPGAQRDVQAIEVQGAGSPEMAATYLVGDQLAVGPGDPEGWSVFYMASYEQRTGYTPFYSEARDYRKGGKAAPHLVDYLNWNGRGGTDVLVQVFGPDQPWYEAVSADSGGRWKKVWEGQPCHGVK